MRNLILLFMAVILGTSATFASTADDKVAERNAYRYNNSYIFVENGITFAVYPDGEFDFYIDSRIGNRRNNVTFNSGFDYSPYAQYDDYGAVIQVENIPIFYDYYGRVSQIGNVDVSYRNGRVRRLGGMNVFYNRNGFYDYHTGFINIYNRSYIYRPFHGFFARPALGFCLVNVNPYRRFYSPIRYSFYNPYRFNRRFAYAKIGKTHRYNNVRKERASVYRNDRRVSRINNNARANRNLGRGNATTVARSNRTTSRGGSKAVSTNRSLRSNNGRPVNRTSTIKRSPVRKTATRSNNGRSVNRTSTVKRSPVRNTATRSSNSRQTVKRSTTVKRSPQRNAVTKRKVTQTPRSRTVTRSTVSRPSQRTSRSANVSSRSSSQRSSVRRAPSNTRSVASRSTSSRSNRSASTSRSRGRQ